MSVMFYDAAEAWHFSIQDLATPIMEGMIFFHKYLIIFSMEYFRYLWANACILYIFAVYFANILIMVCVFFVKAYLLKHL